MKSPQASNRNGDSNPTYSHPGVRRPEELREPPNPCTPEPDGEPCDCHKPKGGSQKPAKPKRPKPRQDACCEQLVDILRQIPGLELPKPHKPKQRPSRKARSLCESLGVSDAILPALSLLWDRYRAGEKGRNKFEEGVNTVFNNLGKKNQDALDAGFAGYAKFRASGKGECLFNDCLAKAGEDGAIERSWFLEELLREGLKVAGQAVFGGSGGVMGPGQVRLWDNSVDHGPNGTSVTIYQGPWPWLTAICPKTSSYEEYGNVASFRPIPGKFHVWQNYQYAQTCDFKPDPAGKIQANCSRQHPAPVPPGTLIGNYCEGGRDYTHNNDCVRIPAQRAGGSLKLRGFNFITPTVKVRFVLTSNPSVKFEQVCTVWGDQETPVKDETAHTIVDERVWDWIDVSIPGENPAQPGAPLPPGIYSIQVFVANTTNAMFDSATPPELASNTLLLRIEPDANVKYLVWSERGRCNRETPGLGDDEIWWDAFVGHLVPNEVPVPTTGASGLQLKSLERKEFPRGPWEDMDDGESAGAYNRDIFGPAAFELYGVAAVAIIGFEVDDEDAAKDQLQGFGNAYWEANKGIVTLSLGFEGLAGTILKIAGATLTQAIIVLAIIAAIALIGAAFWAAWAPADLIALDLFVLDAFSAWDMTDPDKPLPVDTQRFFGDDTGRESISAIGDRLITVTERALPKLHNPGDAAATWVQETTYESPEDSEDSSYTLEFRLARN
jgi:hypothetical protein